jgi:hypothetical protein
MTGHITGMVGIEAGDISAEYGTDWLRFIRFATTISSLAVRLVPMAKLTTHASVRRNESRASTRQNTTVV